MSNTKLLFKLERMYFSALHVPTVKRLRVLLEQFQRVVFVCECLFNAKLGEELGTTTNV